MRVATAIAKTLEAAGTKYCFGYNGHGNWAILDAFVHETQVNTIAARAEDHAVHMADCYWRAHREPPMAIATTSVGPGSTNITPAIASAFFESSALLVLAGGGATHWYGRGGIEEFYRYGPEEWPLTLKPMTKASYSVNRPDTALDSLVRGYKTAITGRPGPVVLQVPFDIQHTEIELSELPDLSQWSDVSRPAPDVTALARAADLISAAERPLVVVSSGIHNARAWDELKELAEGFDLPVETAVPGKGVLPEDHPLSLGCVGRAGTEQANRAARECDVLIGIGTRFGDIDTGGWTLHDIPASTKLVHIDIDPGELGRIYPTEVAINADARLGILGLIEALRSRSQTDRTSWLDYLRQVRTQWREDVTPLRESDAFPMGYARVFSDVSDVVADSAPDATVLFDTGHALSFGPAFLEAKSKNYIHSGFFHRMGWSLPGAIGATIARPDHPTVVLVGDGSFVMTASSLLTAVELGISMVVIVLNNATLQVERELMIKNYGRHALTDYVRLDTGEPHGPDYVMWARSMGAEGVHITSPDQIRDEVSAALTRKAPTVIDVPIDPESPGYRAIHYPYPSDFHAPRVSS